MPRTNCSIIDSLQKSFNIIIELNWYLDKSSDHEKDMMEVRSNFTTNVKTPALEFNGSEVYK